MLPVKYGVPVGDIHLPLPRPPWFRSSRKDEYDDDEYEDDFPLLLRVVFCVSAAVVCPSLSLLGAFASSFSTFTVLLQRRVIKS